MATITNPPSGYKVSWVVTNAEIQSENTSEAEVKWKSDSDENDGWIGTIMAKLKNSDGTVVVESNKITITIKSIKHLKPTMTPFTPGSEIKMSPCQTGQLSLEVPRLEVPGTGILNPDKVNYYLWTLPAGWTMSGHTSDGSTEILGNYYETVTYPASATNGTIKVRGYYLGSCELQNSKYSDPITVTRDVAWKLIASRSSFVCGDTDPITFTMAPINASDDVSCAVYYWNNSQTATSSNTFQITPGNSDLIVTVNAVYGGKSAIKSITIPVILYEGNSPSIYGPSEVCASGTSFYVRDLPATVDSIIWIPGPNLMVYSGQNTNSPVIKATGSGNTSLSVRLVTNCGDIPISSKYVWAGVKGSFTGPSSILVGGSGTFTATSTCSGSQVIYRWWLREEGTGENAEYIGDANPLILLSVPKGAASMNTTMERLSSLDSMIIMQPMLRTYYALSLTVIDANGSYTTEEKEIVAFGNVDLVNRSRSIMALNENQSVVISVYPNPTNSEATVSVEQDKSEETDLKSNITESIIGEDVEWDIEVYDNLQNLKLKEEKLKGRSTKIQTTSWKEGVYMVRVKYKGEIRTSMLVVKK